MTGSFCAMMRRLKIKAFVEKNSKREVNMTGRSVAANCTSLHICIYGNQNKDLYST